MDLSSRFASLGVSTFASNKRAQDGLAGPVGYGEDTEADLKHRNYDREHVQSLVHDARAALNLSKELENGAVSPDNKETPSHATSGIPVSGGTTLKDRDKYGLELGELASDSNSDENDGDTDDEQADEILQNIIDELEVGSEPAKTEPATTSPSPSSNNSEKDQDTKAQPTDPPTTPPPPSSTQPPKPPSEPFSAQNLPDVPTFVPEEVGDHDSSSYKGTSWRNNDATPHWCCICSDDAVRKCFGCEGDSLYCVRCWNEVHLEEGYEEEREHQWVRYALPKRGE